MSDTIFAVSSGAPPAAIAVVRISGPAAFAAVRALAGSLPEPRRASLRRLRDPESGEAIDRALVLVFRGPDTATGEDVAELHTHGGRAVVRAVERVLGTFPGCRPAQAGEFTGRALESGRIDLTEAEGLADLLAAETEAQRRVALRTAEGGVRQRIEAWTDEVIALSAQIEAAIDHSDEEDAADEHAIVTAVHAGAERIAQAMAAVLAQPPVERLRDGIRVVFAGPPNSGKSTLFNLMAGRDAAIVSPVAGTTRDRVEAPVVRDDTAWLLIDTAGLAERTSDPVEAIGIARSRDSMTTADVVLWLGDGPPPTLNCPVVLVHARADLPDRAGNQIGRIDAWGDIGGDAAVWGELRALAREMVPSDDVTVFNQRQRALCCSAQGALCGAANEEEALLIAEWLQDARRQFDLITGRAGMESVLDALFAEFCVGK